MNFNIFIVRISIGKKMTDTIEESVPSPISTSSSSSCRSFKIKIKRSASKTSSANRRSQRRRLVRLHSEQTIFSFISFFYFIRMFNHQCEVVH